MPRSQMILALLLAATSAASGQNPLDRGPAWAGTFGDEEAGVGVVLFPAGEGKVEGAIVVFEPGPGERLCPAEGKLGPDGVVTGTFQVKAGERYPFEARADDHDLLVLSSEGSRYRLARERGGPRNLDELRRALRARAPLEGDEAKVVDTLRQLEVAQRRFHELDPDGDGKPAYGGLDDLVRAGLVDAALARAPWSGYAIEAQASPLDPSRRWAAVARPHPPRPGARSFFINDAGVVHHSSLPLTMPADCEPPLVAVPLGEAEPDWDARGDPRANESSAIGALRTLVTAQALFREGDKDGDGELDYGTIAELGKAQLVSRLLASGRSAGYLFELRVSAADPGDVWSATARPVEPGVTGASYFFTNHAGLIWMADRPFTLDDVGEPPSWAAPLRR